MKDLIIGLDSSSDLKLYEQIYERFKKDIESGEIQRGSKMPSLRRLAKDNDVSVTTVETAYNQLLVEGYIESRPKSGYYVSEDIDPVENEEETQEEQQETGDHSRVQRQQILYDEESFDFYKWKKSMNKVFNNYSHLLRTEADIQGEPMLRAEIAKYLYTSRNVKCGPEQIVVGAGSQQLTTMLTRILKQMNITCAATQIPAYESVREIFSDEGFAPLDIPEDDKGLDVSKLPINMRSIVYVNPSNQYPARTVMPVARRYELIRWAEENDSYILEDDFDSELRYFGRPVPAMKSLGDGRRVIYLGSFSSTLFAGIRISYIVLPDDLMRVFDEIKGKYDQGCSKTEQLTLAIYMRDGYYIRTIKKCRKLYAAKLETALKTIDEYGEGLIEAADSKSGIAVMLKVRTSIPAGELCRAAGRSGLLMEPVDDLCTESEQILCFYFYRVSETMLKILIRQYIQNIKRIMGRK